MALDGELWAFAVAFYGRPGVSAACLTLQDGLALDVNLLLLGLFARLHRGLALDAADIAAADDLIGDWRGAIVKPLREIRTRLKSGPEPAPCRMTDELRTGVKAIELQAEKIELAVLGDWLDGMAPRESDTDPETVLRRIVTHFAGNRSPVREPPLEQAILVLAHEAEQQRREPVPPRHHETSKRR